MARARTLVVRPPGEPERVGRTLRALRQAGVAAEDVGGDLSRAILEVPGPVWLVRAGAWPAARGPLSTPPPTALGLPLVAFGAVVDDPLDVSASLYLDPEPALELARRLEKAGGSGFDEAARSLVLEEAGGFRVVRFSPLDVRYDRGLRVVLAVTSLQRGGAERVVLDLALALRWRGVRCLVASLGRPGRGAFAIPEGVDVVDLSHLGRDRLARAEGLTKVARAFAADLIHGHLLDSGEAALVSAQGRPLVLTIHNQRAGWPEGLEGLGPGDAAMLVGCARAVESELLETGVPMSIRTAWNGIDPGAFAPTPERQKAGRAFRRRYRFGPDDFVLLALANPRPQKRLERLPGVLAATRAELARLGVRREARLVFAGEAAPDLEATHSVALARAEVARLGLERHVRWAGSVADIAGLLAASDVLVSSSAHEGLSLAQLEALAAGVPVVATRAGGIAELADACATDPEAVAVLPLDAEPESFGAILAARAASPVPTALPPDFTRVAMAGRYAWLYPRALAASRPRPTRDGLLLVSNNFSIGGAQSSARRLLTGLLADGVRPRAVVLQEDPAHPTPGRLALGEQGIPVHALPPAGTLDPAEAVARLLGLIDDDPPAAVLLWNVIPEYRLLIADGLLEGRLFDVSPGALSFDALDRYFAHPRPGLPYRTAAEYGARLTGAIVKYRAEAPRALETLRVPVSVIPNGVPIDPAPRPLRPPGAPVAIGTSARINPHKRLELLIAAIRLAHPRLPPYVLRIAGGVEPGCDDHARSLRDQAEGLPLEWLGSLEDARAFLQDLDVFAMVAEPPGCPNASLEAMAAGLPVIATDAGGIAEQVEDRLTGRLVAREDVEALADALTEAARCPDLRAAWGHAGKARAIERFSLARMVREYRRVCLDGSEA